jgi:hypothetical protein
MDHLLNVRSIRLEFVVFPATEGIGIATEATMVENDFEVEHAEDLRPSELMTGQFR